MGSEKKFVNEKAGEAGGIVAENATFFDKIAGDQADACIKDIVAIEKHRFRPLGAITARDFRRNSLAVSDDGIDYAATDVILDGTKVIAEGEMRGFPGLGHQVGNVNAGRIGAHDRAGNFGNQQVGNDTGVKRTGPHENQIGLLDGLNGGGERANTTRIQLDFANGNPAAGDARLAFNARAINKCGDKMNVRERGWKNAAANREYLG